MASERLFQKCMDEGKRFIWRFKEKCCQGCPLRDRFRERIVSNWQTLRSLADMFAIRRSATGGFCQEGSGSGQRWTIRARKDLARLATDDSCHAISCFYRNGLKMGSVRFTHALITCPNQIRSDVATREMPVRQIAPCDDRHDELTNLRETFLIDNQEKRQRCALPHRTQSHLEIAFR